MVVDVPPMVPWLLFEWLFRSILEALICWRNGERFFGSRSCHEIGGLVQDPLLM